MANHHPMEERTRAVIQTSLEHIFSQQPLRMIETLRELEPFSFN